MPYGLSGELRCPSVVSSSMGDSNPAILDRDPGQRPNRSLKDKVEKEILPSDNLSKILKEIVVGVRKVLRVDRAIVCRTRRNYEAVAIAESIVPGRKSMLKCRLGRFFGSHELVQFRAGKLQAIEDLRNVDFDRCPTKVLECFFEVSAKLVVPILLPAANENEKLSLWGLLIAHQCFTPHRWTQVEIDTMVLLANQLAQDIDRERQYRELEVAHEQLQQLTSANEIATFPIPQEVLGTNGHSSMIDNGELPAIEPVVKAAPAPPPKVPSIELLKSYIAYYVSRGKSIVSPVFDVLPFQGVTYNYNGYHLNFESFWRWLKHRPDFQQLYLVGDMRCFGHFLEGRYTVSECERCHLPIPSCYGVAYDVPECALCDDECPVKLQESGREFPMTNVVAVGDSPSNWWEVGRFFEKNRFDVTFVEEPAEIVAQRLRKNIDFVMIRSNLAETEALNWARALRQHPRLSNVPIVALSDRAGYGLPWLQHSLDLEDYLLPPLNGEHLVRHLQSQRQSYQSLLSWFPR